MALSIDEKAVITTTTDVGVALADLAQHLHAVDAGEHQVEEDEIDLLALQDREPLLAGAGDERRVPLLADEHGQDVLQNLFVVDDEDIHAVQRGRAPPAGSARYRGSSTTKQAPSPGPARHPQIAAVPAHDIVADREPETGPAPVELRRVERLEDHLQLLGRDARSAVLHLHGDPRAGRLQADGEPAAGLAHGVDRVERPDW